MTIKPIVFAVLHALAVMRYGDVPMNIHNTRHGLEFRP